MAEAIDKDKPIIRGVPSAEHPEGVIAYQLWTLSSIPDRLAEDGPVALQIGHQWAVGTFTQ